MCYFLLKVYIKRSNNATKLNIEYKRAKREDYKLVIPSKKSHLLEVNNSIKRRGLLEINYLKQEIPISQF